MKYAHRNILGDELPLPIGKIVCVGRNYADHARELSNAVPSSPILFMKPSTALIDMSVPINIPKDLGGVHHELEVALLIGRTISKGSNVSNKTDILFGVGLALDLTLRDIQQKLKASGHPWEIAKGFDGSCPCSSFQLVRPIDNLQNMEFSLTINGTLRQLGHTADMIFPIGVLITEISRYFTLMPGDIVLTGTPAGVAQLNPKDRLVCRLEGVMEISTSII